MPKKSFRSDVAKGIKDGDIGIDRENNIIHGFSVISLGEAHGHDLEIDETTLGQVVELGNKHKAGMKSRFGHPNMSSTAFGTFLGRAKNYVKDGDRVRADLHLDGSSFKTPNGDLGNYVFDLAESDPDAFGSSIAFEGDSEVRLEPDGTRKKNEDGSEMMPLARVERLFATDIVDDPATEDGFFSKTVQLSAEMSTQMGKFLSQEDAVEKGVAFLKRYEHNFGLGENGHATIIEMLKQFSQDTTTGDKPQPTEDLSMPKTPEELEAERVETARKAAREVELKELRTESAKSERDRISTIRALGKKFGVKDEVYQGFIDDGTPMEELAKKFATLETEQMAAVDSNVRVTDDEHDKKLTAVGQSFLSRGGLLSQKEMAEERKSAYRGIGLQGFAREYLLDCGVANAHRFTGAQLYSEVIKQSRRHFDGAMAQSTGDFANVLSNTANKFLARGWEEAGTTYQLWAGSDSLTDFKTADIVKLTSFGDVSEIPEGEAPRHGKLNDLKEQAQLSTWGVYWTIARQAMVNDDMNVFTRVPRSMAGSYRRRINKRVYGLMFNNNGVVGVGTFVGPTMLEDNVRLFNAATHRNFSAIGAGAAISQATLNTAWQAMVTQALPSPDGGRSETIFGNIRPKHLLVGPANEVAASKLISSASYGTALDDGTTEVNNVYGPNGARSGLQLISDAEIDNLLTSTETLPWYLAADANITDTITVFGLNGETQPESSSEPSSIGEAEGMKYQVRGDFVVAAVDWRGLVCNAGR